jgi:hypothetical protein
MSHIFWSKTLNIKKNHENWSLTDKILKDKKKINHIKKYKKKTIIKS